MTMTVHPEPPVTTEERDEEGRPVSAAFTGRGATAATAAEADPPAPGPVTGEAGTAGTGETGTGVTGETGTAAADGTAGRDGMAGRERAGTDPAATGAVDRAGQDDFAAGDPGRDELSRPADALDRPAQNGLGGPAGAVDRQDDLVGPADAAALDRPVATPDRPSATQAGVPSTATLGQSQDGSIPAAELSAEQWPAILAMFVDDPRGAVQRAAAAAEELAAALTASLEREQAALRASWERDAGTEDLRTALQQYRSFCGRLSELGLS
jgi:hypothetical protein